MHQKQDQSIQPYFGEAIVDSNAQENLRRFFDNLRVAILDLIERFKQECLMSDNPTETFIKNVERYGMETRLLIDTMFNNFEQEQDEDDSEDDEFPDEI